MRVLLTAICGVAGLLLATFVGTGCGGQTTEDTRRTPGVNGQGDREPTNAVNDVSYDCQPLDAGVDGCRGRPRDDAGADAQSYPRGCVAMATINGKRRSFVCDLRETNGNPRYEWIEPL